MPHLIHNKSLIHIVIHKNSSICLSYFVRWLWINFQFPAKPFLPLSNRLCGDPNIIFCKNVISKWIHVLYFIANPYIIIRYNCCSDSCFGFGILFYFNNIVSVFIFILRLRSANVKSIIRKIGMP